MIVSFLNFMTGFFMAVSLVVYILSWKEYITLIHVYDPSQNLKICFARHSFFFLLLLIIIIISIIIIIIILSCKQVGEEI